jgi:hypothetical protein
VSVDIVFLLVLHARPVNLSDGWLFGAHIVESAGEGFARPC